MGIKRTVSIRQLDLWVIEPLKSEKMNQKMRKTDMSIFPLYFGANSFVILKGKIAKEDAIFEKSLFCEKCLEYDFTWKKCWFQIKIQNFILMTRPSYQQFTFQTALRKLKKSVH